MISLMLLSLNENPSFKNKPRSALVDWKQLWMESNRRTRVSAPSDGNSRVVASPFNQAGVLRQPAVPGFPAGARASLHMTEGKAQGHLLDAVMCDVSRSLVVGVLDTDFLVEEAFTCPALNYLLECDVDTTLQRMCLLGAALHQQWVSCQDFGKVSPTLSFASFKAADLWTADGTSVCEYSWLSAHRQSVS